MFQMRRDWDLCRGILRLVGNADPAQAYGNQIEPDLVDGYDSVHARECVRLLHEAGLLVAVQTLRGDIVEWTPKWLTWKGNDFLDAIDNDEVWEQVKLRLLPLHRRVSFEIIKSLADDVARARLQTG